MEDTNFQDDLDRIQLDQLHKVVIEFAKNCFEIKKLCVTILVSGSVLIATFTANKLNTALFLGVAIIILFFYILDVQSYFYQEKIRIRMRQIANEMAERHASPLDTPGVGMPVQQKRVDQSRLIHAFFNASMWFYAMLLGIDVILLILFKIGFLPSSLPVSR